ncbi:MAG: nucleotidyl transferase AbiEii/AbiGii toxin family protein [Patescibacteria group bacterium]|nr:nucleotidyl transferase AbiEii/AbiGii toxin family protein [Patescibacteria group bacterium]MBU1420946.1 nucleotidyl transferase AbiEii/AbiGii toxin family protein [Patescibacteria group bacterium]MBU2456773.1 nucleotidyl transferase AbiEii/AbiGii toxin family protein [Patescibacteria group bacterium]
MLQKILKEIVKDKKAQGLPDFVIKNYVKEFLQYPALDFIYNNKNYKNFIFTGGSCLRICFNAPRLSEDLDFDLFEKDYKKLNFQALAEELKLYFKTKYLINIIVKCQADKRTYLKFPLLKKLNLTDQSESDLLYVKIEPSISCFKKPDIEFSPISFYGFNFVVKNYSLPFLMTGKLNAIFNREWFKGKQNEINIKGRDFYDLFWYLQKGVSPDWKNLKKVINISSENELKKELLKFIDKNVTSQKLSYDLKNFFSDQHFISDFCENYRKIMEKYL